MEGMPYKAKPMFQMQETLRSTNLDFNIQAYNKFIKNIYTFSVLEDAFSTKCIIFSFHLKFNNEQKNEKCKTGRQKSGFFCINSSKIYKQIPE